MTEGGSGPRSDQTQSAPVGPVKTVSRRSVPETTEDPDEGREQPSVLEKKGSWNTADFHLERWYFDWMVTYFDA